MLFWIGSHTYHIGSLIEDCLYGWIANSNVHTIFFKPYADHEVKTVTKELKTHKFMTGYEKNKTEMWTGQEQKHNKQ